MKILECIYKSLAIHSIFVIFENDAHTSCKPFKKEQINLKHYGN